MLLLLQYLTVVFSLCGLVISVYIFTSVKAKKVLVCPIGTKCNEVVRSKYATTFGISNSILGIFYYGITAASYMAFSLRPELLQVAYWGSAVAMATALALIFSSYLIFVQGVVLKKWCFWCVSSSLCTLAIFILLSAQVWV